VGHKRMQRPHEHHAVMVTRWQACAAGGVLRICIPQQRQRAIEQQQCRKQAVANKANRLRRREDRWRAEPSLYRKIGRAQSCASACPGTVLAQPNNRPGKTLSLNHPGAHECGRKAQPAATRPKMARQPQPKHEGSDRENSRKNTSKGRGGSRSRMTKHATAPSDGDLTTTQKRPPRANATNNRCPIHKPARRRLTRPKFQRCQENTACVPTNTTT